MVRLMALLSRLARAKTTLSVRAWASTTLRAHELSSTVRQSMSRVVAGGSSASASTLWPWLRSQVSSCETSAGWSAASPVTTTPTVPAAAEGTCTASAARPKTMSEIARNIGLRDYPVLYAPHEEH